MPTEKHEADDYRQSQPGRLLLAIGYATSFLYLLSLYFGMTTNTTLCGPPPDWVSVLPRIFRCLEANEIGDFLAGVFAPLAFLWLYLAVRIQSLELRAQIDEQVEARKVATRAGETLEAQATAARETAAFMKEQTSMLAAEERRRGRADADAQLDARTTVIVGDMSRFFKKSQILCDHSLVSVGFGGQPTNSTEALALIVKWVEGLDKAVSNFGEVRGVEHLDAERLDALSRDVASLLAYHGKVSIDRHHALDILESSDALTKLERAASLISDA